MESKPDRASGSDAATAAPHSGGTWLRNAPCWAVVGSKYRMTPASAVESMASAKPKIITANRWEAVRRDNENRIRRVATVGREQPPPDPLEQSEGIDGLPYIAS